MLMFRYDMKIYSTKSHVLLEDCGNRLIFSKLDGKCEDYGLTEVIPDAADCGSAILFIGSISVEGCVFLLVVTQSSVVGHFQSDVRCPIYRIDKVQAIPVHADARSIKQILDDSSAGGKLKQGTGRLLKFVQDKIGTTPSVLDELLRLFNDDPDFYYCKERDITQSTQRFFSKRLQPDKRFFWNRYLLEGVVEASAADPSKISWITPITQGFVSSVELSLQEDPIISASLELTLISRRSVQRAGARYLRRGIDSDSYVANFVESELILNIFDHHLSFVQVRGSVPVFWSQRGFKYRPPLSIDRPLEESFAYFETHMDTLGKEYGLPLTAVNLVDLTGRELRLAQSYLEHSLKYNNDDMVFVSFDLHHHCRGLRFDKVSTLINQLDEVLTQIGFCWVDKTGELVREQNGIIRTNCVDCLDRTNVVQGAISQAVCMRQAQRLGIFGPLADPPEALVSVLQTMWADNGDALSTQYAGTAALKGDVTRCGERRLAGIMKDGYNSASRYYLSHVRDSARQKAINLLLGIPDQGTESMAVTDSDEPDAEEDENVSRLVNETIHFLLPEGEVVVGGWGLVDSRENGENVDTVLLLTRSRLHIALYDDEAEKLMDVRIIPLEDIDSIEIGRPSRSARLHIRIVGKSSSHGAWAWRAAKTRLFNNVAIRLKTSEEADEYAESIAEQIRVAYEMSTGRELILQRPQRLATGGQGAARKAFASMTSVLRMRTRRPSPTTAKTDDLLGFSNIAAADSGMCTPQDGDLTGTDHSSGLGVEICGAFRDDQQISSSHLGVVSDVRPSASDGRLSERASGMSLVSRLKGLRPQFRTGTTGFGASSAAVNPFEKLLPLMSDSKTNVILL